MTQESLAPLCVSRAVIEQIGEHCIARYRAPNGFEEACGLLVGTSANNTVTEFHAVDNVAASARIYELDAKQHMMIERDVESRGLEVVGVMHSHTHTEAYPSATDVARAPDPIWHYMIVTLMRGVPEPRSYRIVAGQISEEHIEQD